MLIQVYEHKPEDFDIYLEVAACYVIVDDKLLLLQRSTSSRHEPSKWGVPAGKLEKGETPINAAVRELYEETGIVVMQLELKSIGKLYISKIGGNYIFHMFCVNFENRPLITLAVQEQQAYRWLTVDEAASFDLMSGGHEALLYYCRMKENEKNKNS